MKKWLCLLLVLLLSFETAFVLAEGTDEAPVEELTELVVGHTTAMSGNFMNHVFGNNTSDFDVQSLIHGYYLVCWSRDYCTFDFDPVVVGGNSIMENTANGNRIYTIALHDDLYYSDGTKITARDYAFSVLLSAAPQIREIGGNVNDADYIVGMDEFKSGETDKIAGVRVMGDYVLQIEVKGEYLPYFYELGLLNYCPMPIHLIAPECEIADDGDGIYVRDIGKEEGPSELFTAELLQKTLLDPVTGYVSHPAVSSGAYQLISYDREADVAEFEINPYYISDPLGNVPSIPKIIYRHADNETVIDELREGTLGLFNKALKADTIRDGIQLVTSGIDHAFTNYLRIGYSYIACCWEKPAIKHQAVRQAIAYCFDKDTFVQDYCANFGVRVYGYYGIGQWMYELVEGTIEPPYELAEDATPEETAEYEATMAAWDELSLDNLEHYDLNTAKAEKLLIEDGWTLNKDGEPYDAKVDEYRCKMVDDELVELNLSLIYPEGNEFGDGVQTLLIDNLAKVGIKLTVEPMEFTKLLQVYYREVERNVDLIYMATNFTEVFEPSNTFDPADAETHYNNRTACTDQELYDLAVEMRLTPRGDILEYATDWVAFQERYAEILPTIPVYGNIYFDFYTAALQDYFVSSNMDWTEAIVGAVLNSNYKAEMEALLNAEDEEELDDGELEFED